jgi:hypothetical protein
MSVADSNERLYSLTRFRAVTPGTTDLRINGVAPRAIYVAVAGDVTVLGDDDTATVTLTGLAAGVWHPLSPQQITAATATGIVAGY